MIPRQRRGRWHFNLVDDPWIPVVERGALREVSIREALLDAHRLGEVVGDLPTQVAPILRLLVAILARCVGGPRDLEAWRKLWEVPKLPGDRIDRYLRRWRQRFDLFDPEAPFMQVPLGADRTTTAAQLVPELPTGDNVPLFRPQQDDEPPALSPAEAARWLLHLHAWDTAGIKTGRRRDRQARGNKSYGNPVGSLGDIGVVIPIGRNLRETLLLNLLPTEEDLLIANPGDAPTWERDPLGPRWSERRPAGPLELLTWPSRRPTLVPEEGPEGTSVVRRVCVGGGDRLGEGSLFRLEPHTAWRRVQGSRPDYRPHRHDPSRVAWRGLGALLAAKQTEGEAFVAPHVLEWVGRLKDDGVRGLPPLLDVLLLGITYGQRRAVVEEVYWDRLPVPVLALSEQRPHCKQLVLDCVQDAEAVAQAIWGLASALREAAGDRDRERVRRHAEHVRRQFFAGVDAQFRDLLRDLAHAQRMDELRGRWRNDLRRAALDLADTLLDNAPTAALAGRPAEAGASRSNAWVAERRFRAELSRALGQASVPLPASQDVRR